MRWTNHLFGLMLALTTVHGYAQPKADGDEGSREGGAAVAGGEE